MLKKLLRGKISFFVISLLLLVALSGCESLSIEKYNLTVTTDPVGSGQIVLDPEKTEYARGEDVTLTAQVNEGFEFVEWQDGSETYSENPLNLTLNSNQEITAVFNSLNLLPLITSTTDGSLPSSWSISGDTSILDSGVNATGGRNGGPSLYIDNNSSSWASYDLNSNNWNQLQVQPGTDYSVDVGYKMVNFILENSSWQKLRLRIAFNDGDGWLTNLDSSSIISSTNGMVKNIKTLFSDNKYIMVYIELSEDSWANCEFDITPPASTERMMFEIQTCDQDVKGKVSFDKLQILKQ